MAVARAAATWLVRVGSFELWLRKMRGFVPRIASAQTLIHHVIAEDLRRSLSRATRHLPHSLARHSRSTEVLDGLRVHEVDSFLDVERPDDLEIEQPEQIAFDLDDVAEALEQLSEELEGD